MAPHIFGPAPTYPGSNYEPQWGDRVLANSPKMFNNWRRDRAFKKLEIKVAGLVASAERHQQNGLPPGSEAYQILHQQAALLVDEFSRDWNEPTSHILSNWPEFKTLQNLATGRMPVEVGPGAKIFIAGLALIVGLPLVFGIMYLIFHLITTGHLHS